MPTDFELLDAWRSGDPDAGNELFNRYFQSIYRFFRNKAGEGIEDLVQQTFLACVEGRDRFRKDASFRTYLFSAARKLLYKEYHRRGKGDNVDFGVSSLHDLMPSPSRVMVEHAEQRLLLEGLRRIPLDYQIALELYHWEGMSGPELAAALDVPEATVRSRLRRGMERLRQRMEEIAQSGEQLKSTLANLDDWARSLRDRVSPPST